MKTFNYFYQKNKIFLFGISLLFFLLLLNILLPLFLFADNQFFNLSYKSFLPSSKKHWLGTDFIGHDLFEYIIKGMTTSLYISVSAIFISGLLGCVLGLLGGYFHGFFGFLTNFICDLLIVCPDFILAFLIVLFYGRGACQLIIVLSICYLPTFIKNIKAATIQISQKDFVKNAFALGASHFYIIKKHVFPHILNTLLIRMTLSLSSVILVVSYFGFIGVGLDSSIPEWGSLLSMNRLYADMYPRLFFYPMIFIILTNLSFNCIAEGLMQYWNSHNN
ncbi:ABC transporter permease [Candidatus Phytoplasma melaleucae]|uniref:ABC transporter permease n=1 Tax=Candidatus Phytoplasma melaleucae TaxID=2982630 RepID=A0ABT9DDK5_9MOLU|nr:ABC transporter permease ['Melaleuca sp.' phytoplasma]MDO8167929.1 ABC transporter permease ['Melaleuca sp.' phytoplasma]